MALHSKDDIREELLDDVYASTDLSVVMPKYKIPEKEHAPRHAFSVVRDELMLDGNARQNLATFCQTWLEPEVHELMDLSVDKNMIDKDEYPQTAEIKGAVSISWPTCGIPPKRPTRWDARPPALARRRCWEAWP